MDTKVDKKINHKRKKGFTFVEIMIAVVILFIAIIGTSADRYGASLNARKADLHATAVRTAMLLCEGWNGKCGAKTFNPILAFGSKIDITASEGPDEPDGFYELGSYVINFEKIDYFVTLSWQQNGSELRILNVTVNWDQTGRNTGELSDASASYSLMTYVENPV